LGRWASYYNLDCKRQVVGGSNPSRCANEYIVWLIFLCPIQKLSMTCFLLYSLISSLLVCCSNFVCTHLHLLFKLFCLLLATCSTNCLGISVCQNIYLFILLYFCNYVRLVHLLSQFLLIQTLFTLILWILFPIMYLKMHWYEVRVWFINPIHYCIQKMN
jgi:hypothetical protein